MSQSDRAVIDSTLPDLLDPLDREILERAFDGALAMLKQDETPSGLEGDEALEASLRRELLEIARSHGVDDPEALRDMLLAALSQR